MDLLKCQTCGLGFDSSVAHKEHYRTELHRYNLKRRTNDLGPVSETEYQRRKAAAQSLAGMSTSTTEAFHAKCQPCNRSFASKATLNQHLKSRKHLTMAEGDNGATATKVKATVAPSSPTTIKIPGSMDEAAGEEGSNKKGEEECEVAAPVDLSPDVCIFCNERCPSVESAVLHMWKQHGFHLPDGEYLVDVHGLLRYCAEKVKVGCMCLYCNGKGKGFLTARDVQRHMHAKSHCKLLYEEGEDLHEFRPFYDFSASYALPPCSKKMTRGKVKAQERRMDDDEQSLETVDSDYEEVSGDEDEGMIVGREESEDEDDEEDEDVEQMLRQGALQVSELGELMLPDGRCLGRREYQRYYKQRYRPEDTRSSLVASKHEAAGRMGPGMESYAVMRAGGTGSLMVRGGAGGEGLWGPDKAARRAVMKVTAAARRVRDKYRLRKEISTNKFHKRPQIDG